MRRYSFILAVVAAAFSASAQPIDTCSASQYSAARQLLLHSSTADHYGRIRGYALGDIDSMTFSETGLRIHYRWTASNRKVREYPFAVLDSATVLKNPQFTVISPNGGENHRMGDTIWATWAVDKKKRQTPADFLYLTVNGGQIWCQLIIPSAFSLDPSRTPHNNAAVYDSGCVGTYPIVLADSISVACPTPRGLWPVSTQCLFKVDDMYDQNGCQWDGTRQAYAVVAAPSDQSNAYFTITR